MDRYRKKVMLNRMMRTKTKTRLRESIKKFNMTRKRTKTNRKKTGKQKKLATAKKFKI